MGYRVHRENDKFKIVEVNKGEVKDVLTGLSQEEAKATSRRLNFGGGFDGFTPDFFLQKLDASV